MECQQVKLKESVVCMEQEFTTNLSLRGGGIYGPSAGVVEEIVYSWHEQIQSASVHRGQSSTERCEVASRSFVLVDPLQLARHVWGAVHRHV